MRHLYSAIRALRTESDRWYIDARAQKTSRFLSASLMVEVKGKAAPRIDTPSDGTGVAANRTTYIAGVAFSGNQGISEVDVSTDAGQTWQQATLKRPLSALTWVLWELAWQPKLGDYIIVVRAVDLAGNVQEPHEDPPFPNGSSGYHSLGVTAV